MANHGSATMREATPHANETRTNTIMNALKERAQSVLNDPSLDDQSRAILCHALETNDPWLAEMVRRADVSQTPEKDDADLSREKIETLADIICGGSNNAAAALLVLMGTFQNSADPTVLAHTVKHFAFTRCGELNVFGMVDAQIAVLEGELFVSDSTRY